VHLEWRIPKGRKVNGQSGGNNGVVVQNNKELKGPTIYRRLAKYPAQHPAKAPIRLQQHGYLVDFRNFSGRYLSQTTKQQIKKILSTSLF